MGMTVINKVHCNDSVYSQTVTETTVLKVKTERLARVVSDKQEI